MSMNSLLQNLINAVALGGTYALFAIGYTQVYSIIQLINMAHANIFTAGIVIAFGLMAALGTGAWIPAYVLAILLTGMIGVLVERIAYKPLRDAPKVSVIISAIAMSYILENLTVMFFGGQTKGFLRPAFFDYAVVIGGVSIQVVNIFIIALTVILLFAMNYIIQKTRMGRAMRCVSNDVMAVKLMGCNVDKIISLTFFMGSALAAVAGILIAIKYPQVNAYLGNTYGNKAFVAAIIGGIGSLTGAVIGGVLIGVFEIMFVAFFPSLSGLRDVLSFGLLIVVLLIKPTGFMGKKGRDKV